MDDLLSGIVGSRGDEIVSDGGVGRYSISLLVTLQCEFVSKSAGIRLRVIVIVSIFYCLN